MWHPLNNNYIVLGNKLITIILSVIQFNYKSFLFFIYFNALNAIDINTITLTIQYTS